MKLVGAQVIVAAQSRHADARGYLAAWVAEVKAAVWSTPNEIRERYGSVDFVGDRAVFNVRGNRYRLIARINFAGRVVQVRWFGTHAEYDRINVEEV